MTNQYEIDRKKEEQIAQFWKSDEPEPMPNAVAQTEYQNPELRKQKELEKAMRKKYKGRGNEPEEGMGLHM